MPARPQRRSPAHGLQAQASGAKGVGFCNTGGDMENCVKQAHEFSLARNGMKVVSLFGFITEVKSMGLDVAQGLLVSETFYWNMNERTRAFTKGGGASGGVGAVSFDVCGCDGVGSGSTWE